MGLLIARPTETIRTGGTLPIDHSHDLGRAIGFLPGRVRQAEVDGSYFYGAPGSLFVRASLMIMERHARDRQSSQAISPDLVPAAHKTSVR